MSLHERFSEVEPYKGVLYRSVQPIRARYPLSGEGARKTGGRFNPIGVPALYTSETPMTTIREANEIDVLQPLTIVSCRADIHPVFDATREENLADCKVEPGVLEADDWRIQMREDGTAPSQAFAMRLISKGWAGLGVRSFAKGASDKDINVVLWKWGPDLPTQLMLNDDEGRLGRLSIWAQLWDRL